MELFEQRDEVIYDGVCVARMRLVLPDMEGCAGDFYRELADKASGWFKSKLSVIATEDYRRCSDERKRWRYPPAAFYIKSSVAEDEHKYICRLEVIASRSSGEFRRRTRRQVWCKKYGRMTANFGNRQKRHS